MPLKRGLNKAGRPCDVLYCQYAYSISRRLYEQLCADLRDNPRIMFRNYRGKVPHAHFIFWT